MEDNHPHRRHLPQQQQPQKKKKKKPKVVVVMGATGVGKSRLAVDLASAFPDGALQFEIVNADSMQVYRGLDVLTNKIPLHQRNGVPHHLLGTIHPAVQFTSRDFRDLAVPIVDDVLSRGRIPVLVGGTNYYIQALVSPFLVDDLIHDQCCTLDAQEELFRGTEEDREPSQYYHLLKTVDPVAADRIHPNDHRKAKHYLELYASSRNLPSELLRGTTSMHWGQPGDFRYDCFLIWLDASLPVIDRYVDERVDCMMKDGLLDEVFDIYDPAADYTQGLRQAIGVREFEMLCHNYVVNGEKNTESSNDGDLKSGCPEFTRNIGNLTEGSLKKCFLPGDNNQRVLLNEATDKLKANTRRLVRRQKRRLNRLKTLFGWDLHYFDATKALEGNSETFWQMQVLEPCISLVKTFLEKNDCDAKIVEQDTISNNLDSRDLWTQYACEACGGRILRGAHEWEQHKSGRGHRKRISSLKKKSMFSWTTTNSQVTA